MRRNVTLEHCEETQETTRKRKTGKKIELQERQDIPKIKTTEGYICSKEIR